MISAFWCGRLNKICPGEDFRVWEIDKRLCNRQAAQANSIVGNGAA
jgi:hypothetical protein